MQRVLMICLALLLSLVSPAFSQDSQNFAIKWRKAETSQMLAEISKRELRLIQFKHQGVLRYGLLVPDRPWAIEFLPDFPNKGRQPKPNKGRQPKPIYALGGANYTPTDVLQRVVTPPVASLRGAKRIRVRVIDQATWSLKRAEFSFLLSKAEKVKIHQDPSIL